MSSFVRSFVRFASLFGLVVSLAACTSSPEFNLSTSSGLLEEQAVTPVYKPGIPFVEEEDLTPAELEQAEDRGNVQILQEHEFNDGTTHEYLTVGDYVIEGGDMIVSTVADLEEELEDQEPEAGNHTLTAQGALLYTARGWPNNIIYVDERSYSGFTSTQVTAIRNAMQHITNKTNLGFRTRTTGNRLYFQNSSGCSSFIGMYGTGSQALYLADNCFASVNPEDNFGTIVHELTHAAGIMHEHQRVDRDDYIDVNWGNLTQKGRENIEPKPRDSYRTGYDYPSVMHYPRRITDRSFVKNPNIDTITTPGYTGVVASQRLTPRDIQTYNHLYR